MPIRHWILILTFIWALTPTVLASSMEEVYSGVNPQTQAPEQGVLCSCVQTVRTFVPDLPIGNAEDFKPNSLPFEGSVVLFHYPNGVHHIAYIDKIEADRFHIKQGNKTPCQYSEEWIQWDNSSIVGFYVPVDNSDRQSL